MARFPFSCPATGSAPGGWSRPGTGNAARGRSLAAAVYGVAERLRALRIPGAAASYRDLRPVLDAGGKVAAWRDAEAGLDLYGGLAGIALFLAQWAECLDGEARSEREGAAAAAAAARTEAFQAWRRLSRDVEAETGGPRRLRTIGAYTGWGGLVYAAVYLGRLWGREELLDQAEEWTRHIAEQLEEEPLHDLVSGSAGALLAVLRLFALRPSSGLRNLALSCGEHLLDAAVRRQDGSLAWESGPSGEGRLRAGLSHGAAGIAWALAELSARSGEARFLTAARRALAFERDELLLRLRGEPGAPVLSWCHGLPGMGIARLAVERSALGYREEEEAPRAPAEPGADGGDPRARCREEVSASISALLRCEPSGSHCLCHGDLGDLDFLLLADRLATKEMLPLGREVLLRKVRRRSLRVAGEVAGAGPLCGLLTAEGERAEVPGLMVGLAGIGYGLLRAADPATVPSVLMLELPARPSRAGLRGG